MIHLVNMPFASLLRPSLPLSQIKAQLAEVGLPARVFNLNFDFALEAGFEAFEMVALLRGVDSQIGEWLFAESAWGRPVGPPEEEFLRICGTETESLKQLGDPVGWLRTLKHEVVPSFLDACVDRLASFGEPKVVGFSCTFFQTIASLALARRLRERYPNVKLVFGGACFHDQMGQELIRKVELVDAVSLGEADDVIVPLFQALWEGRAPEGLHAVWYRDEAGEVVEGPAHRPVTEAVLEAIPDPDYDDYFEDMERVGLNDRRSLQRVFLPYESSRGCWWGQKQHCTFCGLNGDGMSFRAKSAEKVLKTIDGLLERYPKATKLQASDNIMPAPYYKNFLPELAKRRQQRSFELFYEIKANVTREKVRALGAAGVAYVQPGIESLSTPLLKLLRKGVSALQNVHLIKLCRTYGVIPAWNILIRLPGEEPEHYAEMAALIPKMVHFCPPFGGPRMIELHRFSPYFFEKERWTTEVKPREWYQGLFPADQIDLEKVAYYFDARWKDTLEDESYDATIDATWTWVLRWRNTPRLPRCELRPQADGSLEIFDERGGAAGTWRLSPAEAAVYGAIDDPMSAKKVHKALEESQSLEQVEATLREFVAHGLAMEENGVYLGFALPQGIPEPSWEFRQRHFLNKVGQEARRQKELAERKKRKVPTPAAG